jgi:peptidyl-prolyl cis-trans isomerase C
MFNSKSRKLVSSLIATFAIFTATVQAQEVVYGTVNGENITKEDIAVIVRNPNIDFNALPKKNKNQIIDKVVEKKLLTEKAVKSGIEKDKAYKESLVKLKKDLSLELWMQKEFRKVKVSDKEKKDFYNKNKSKFKVPAILEARHILVKTEKEAKDIIKTLDKASNKKDEFIKLAKEKSVGPTGPKGGYLGKFPENKMVPEFSKAAKALKNGSYTKTPVKTQFGFHVIYLENKTAPKNLEFSKVEKRITQVLMQQKFQAKIKKEVDALRKKAKIVIK